MKWKRKRNQHLEGTKRINEKFLFLPREDEDGYIRWMEKAIVEEIWCQNYTCIDVVPCPMGNFKWRINKVLASEVKKEKSNE